MLDSIELGKNYAIRLSDIYGGGKYNVNIIGTTTIDNVSKNQDEYNIYETFFKPYGLGLTTYYTAIGESTPIYICAEITSLAPFTIDTSSKIFIPKTLINMLTSDEYVATMNITFQIYPLMVKMISDDSERAEYLEDISDKIKNRLKTLVEFSNMDTELDCSYDTIYIEKASLDTIESERNTEYLNVIQRQKDIKDSTDYKERQFNEQYTAMIAAQKAYEKGLAETEAERERLYSMVETYKKQLNVDTDKKEST